MEMWEKDTIVVPENEKTINRPMTNRLVRQMQDWERASLEAYYQSRRKAEKANLRYFLAQKMCGLILIALTIVSAICLGDATIGIILVPLGIYLLFTREKVMQF